MTRTPSTTRAFGTGLARVRGLAKPLTVAQVLSSAGGVLPMLLAARAMVPQQFATFALLSLAASTLVGLVRAGLLQPALIHRRQDKRALVPARYALAGALVSALGLTGVAVYLHLRDPWVLLLLAVTAVVPACYDWLRFLAMSLDRRWAVAQGDGIRVVLVVVAAFVPALRSDAIALQAYVAACLVVPAIWLVVTLPRVRVWTPYRGYARSAGWQTVDFVFGQTLTTVPLLVLGGTGSVALIAGVRLAQSLLGPLNLMFSAGVTNLVADGATRDELSTDEALLRRGSALGRLLSAAALACVLALLAVVTFSGPTLNGVSRDALRWGLVLIGTSLVTSGWAGVRAVVLRLLNRQAVATLARVVIAVLTGAGFVLGYLAGGTDTSLIGGFAVLTISSPLVFLAASAPTYAAVRSARRVPTPDVPPPSSHPHELAAVAGLGVDPTPLGETPWPRRH